MAEPAQEQSHKDRLAAHLRLVADLTDPPAPAQPFQLPPLPRATLKQQAAALAHELTFVEKRLLGLADKAVLKREFVTTRIHHLRSAMKTLQELADRRSKPRRTHHASTED